MKILIVLHSFIPYTQAGTEIYAYSLAKELAKKHEVYVFFRINNLKLKEYAVLKNENAGIKTFAINFTFRDCRSFPDTYNNSAIDNAFSQVLDEVQPDVVHIHHLLFLSLGIVKEAKRRGLPVIFTLHDYWLFCHRGQLINDKLYTCNGYENSRCGDCLRMQLSIRPKAMYFYQIFRKILPLFLLKKIKRMYLAVNNKTDLDVVSERYKHAHAIIPDIDLFLSPSNFLMDKMISFGVPQSKISYLQTGIEQELFKDATKIKSNKIRFGYIGIILPMKGLDVLVRAFRKLSNPNAQLLIFGKCFPYAGYEDYFKSLESYSRADKRIKLMGAFEHTKVAEIFAQIDVLVVPSIWPENSPLVIQEAFLTKTPVIASRIGGIPELIENGKNGLLFNPNDTEDLHEKLSLLINDSILLEKLRDTVTNVKDTSEISQELVAAYNSLKQGKIS